MKREDNVSNIRYTIYCEYPNPFKPGTTSQEIIHRGTEEMALNEIEKFKEKIGALGSVFVDGSHYYHGSALRHDACGKYLHYGVQRSFQIRPDKGLEQF